ncbi:hypothetical protein [Botrimarina sp.]|uniref:hypothetical protein n=1 Tax=Botrimarina sp. TaxID=2795802 RepID=UPI0032ED1B04
MIHDGEGWRHDAAAHRKAFAKVDTAARAAGLTGDGDLEAGQLQTLQGVLRANELYLEATLGPLPTWLQDACLDRCRRIVANTSPTTAPANETGETESTVAAKATDAAERLGLDGDAATPHKWADLSDDAQRVAARLCDEFLEAARLPRDLADHAHRVACSLAGSSSEERIGAAVRRLRMLPDPLSGTDADAEAAELAWRDPEPPKPKATGPAFDSGKLSAMAAALRGGAIE